MTLYKGVYPSPIPALLRSMPVELQNLITGLDDKNWWLRRRSATVLGQLGSAAKEAVPALTGALKDEEWLVRRAAALALGQLGPDAEEAVPALTEALRDDRLWVQEAAAAALKSIRQAGRSEGSERKG